MKHLLTCILAAGFAFASIGEAEASTFTCGNQTFEVALPEESMVLELPEATVITSMSENNVFFVISVPFPVGEDDEDEMDEEVQDFVEQDDLDDTFEEIRSILETNDILLVDFERSSEDGAICIIGKAQGNNQFGWDGYLHIRLHVSEKNVFALMSAEETLEPSEKTLQFFDSFRILQ